jgi:ABC-type dipeptide/oligopeptide/nickel transport system permease component
MKSIIGGIFHLFLLLTGLFLLSGVSALLQYDYELVINLDAYFDALINTFGDVFNLSSVTIKWEENGKSYPLSDVYGDTYFYSFSILLLSFILAIATTIVISFVTMLVPRKVQRFATRILDFFDAFPDVFVVVLLQLLIIWMYKKTNILLFDIYTLGEERIYFLPIVCLAILPVNYLVKHFLFQLKEEESKPYFEFSFSKGFAKSYTIWVHLFRNVWVHFFYHSKPVFLLMLSNLLIIEILFNIHGYMKAVLITSTHSPMGFFVGMVFIFLPFFIIYSIGSIGLRLWLKGAENNE